MRTLKTILCIATALSVLAFALAIYYTQFYKDVVPPEIRMDADVITVSADDGDEALLRGVTATDNRDGDITGAVLVDGVSQLTGPNAAEVKLFQNLHFGTPLSNRRARSTRSLLRDS